MIASTSLLLVDDDAPALECFCLCLRHAGYQVTAAPSPEAALASAAATTFDLAILDVRLPVFSGIELAEYLQKQYGIPTLFVSAHDDQATVDLAIGAGGLGFLVKPVEPASLMPAVEAALARSRDLKRMADQSNHLERALAANRIISVAIGVTMAKSGLTEAEAFEHMRRLARQRREKLETIAGEIVAALKGSAGDANGR